MPRRATRATLADTGDDNSKLMFSLPGFIVSIASQTYGLKHLGWRLVPSLAGERGWMAQPGQSGEDLSAFSGFRRQVVIGCYVADFCCADPRMIIELDDRSMRSNSSTTRSARANSRTRAIQHCGSGMATCWPTCAESPTSIGTDIREAGGILLDQA